MSESKLSSVLPNNTIKDVYPRKPISTLYAENSNNFSTFEDVMYNNDIVMNFASYSPGASNVFRFSRTYQFLGPIICRFTADTPATGTGRIFQDYLAYKLIKEIRWTVGGTELLRISGDSLVPLVLDQCESEAKKIRVLKNAGTKVAAGVAFDAAALDISCVLPLPFSSIGVRNFSNLQKPFPLHMLSEPLELQIDFNNFDEVSYMIPGTLKKAELHFQYGKIGNPEQLKRTIYKFPFNSIFSHRYQFAPTVAGGATNITLNGFRKGEVTMIQFYATLAAVANDNFEGLKLNNIELLFNGQIIWKGGSNDEIWDLCYNNEPCIHGMRPCKTAATLGGISGFKEAISKADTYNVNTAIGANGAIINATSGDFYYYYNIPISEILPKYTGLGHSLGADFSKQTISLNISGLTNAPHLLKVAYHYKAMYQFDNEQALLVF